MFRYFVLEEVYEYAEQMGYSRDDVEVEYDGSEYEVSFGVDCSEVWVWEFEDLSMPAVDYEHCVWGD